MCRNWKLWAVLAVIAGGAVVLSPLTFTAVAPLLMLAMCPLMMFAGGSILYRGARTATERRDAGPNATGVGETDEVADDRVAEHPDETMGILR